MVSCTYLLGWAVESVRTGRVVVMAPRGRLSINPSSCDQARGKMRKSSNLAWVEYDIEIR